MIPNKIAWILFELPNLLFTIYYVNYGQTKLSEGYINFILILPFFLHYINRTFIYPLRNPSNKPFPLEIVISALIFTLCNGYLQNKSLLDTKDIIGMQIFCSLHFYLGILVFLTGMYINIRSDNILMKLKSEIQKKSDSSKEKQYQIPREFLFNYISQPNYFGEIL